MNGTFFSVSGLDPHDSADIAFVWCRPHGQDGRILVGSGHVVPAASNPPPWHPGGTVLRRFPAAERLLRRQYRRYWRSGWQSRFV